MKALKLILLPLSFCLAFAASAQEEYTFSKGKSVYGDLKWGVIKKGGKVVVPFQYDTAFTKTASHFCFGKLVGSSLLAGVTDARGNEIVAFKYHSIDFLPGFFCAIDSEGKSVIIDLAGNEKAEGFYKDVKADTAGIKARTFNSWWVYNKSQIIGDSIMADSLSILNNEILAYRSGKPYIHPFRTSVQGKVKSKERTVCPENFRNLDSPGLVKDSVRALYTQIMGKSEGFIGVQKDAAFGFIDSTGKVRISLQYEGIGPFSEGHAAVKLTGKWGYIDANEKLVIQPFYDKAMPFCHGVARVKTGDKINFTGFDGVLKNSEGFDSVAIQPTGNWLLINKNKKGLADATGRELIIPKYDLMNDQGDNYAIVKLHGLTGVIDYQQNFVVPFQYDFVTSENTGWFFAGKSGSVIKIGDADTGDKKKKNGK